MSDRSSTRTFPVCKSPCEYRSLFNSSRIGKMNLRNLSANTTWRPRLWAETYSLRLWPGTYSEQISKQSMRIPTMPITDSDLMAITIPSDADHRRSEATLGCSYHAEVIGIRQGFCC